MAYGVGATSDWTLRTGSSAKLTDTSRNVIATCTGSTVTGEQKNASATWITIEIKQLKWENCSQVTNTVKTGKLTVMWTAGNNGEIWADETEVTVAIFGVSCTYGAGGGTKLGTFTGGGSPILNISTVVNRTAGNEFLCPSTAGWDAEYELTEPHAVLAVN